MQVWRASCNLFTSKVDVASGLFFPSASFLLLACRPDLDFINLRIDKTAIARLEEVANTPFKRLSYTDAIARLEQATKSGHKFEYPVGIGCLPDGL